MIYAALSAVAILAVLIVIGWHLYNDWRMLKLFSRALDPRAARWRRRRRRAF